MKFITSRIISPGKVRSLMEIIADKEAQEIKQKEEKTVKASSSNKKQTKTASASGQKIQAPEKKEEVKKTVAKKAVETVEKTASNKNVKEVKATKKVASNKVGIVWKKIRSEAALSAEDKTFLREYFSKYYPAEYMEALIAQY